MGKVQEVCKRAREMQRIPSRLNEHCEKSWSKKVPEAEAVKDYADEVQMTSADPIPDTLSLSMPSMSTSTPVTTIMSRQKRTHVTHRYASLSVVKDSAVVSTSDACAERIDEQIGRYFFAITHYNIYPCSARRVY